MMAAPLLTCTHNSINSSRISYIEIIFRILTFPPTMVLESLTLKNVESKQELQEIILAMQCRYSILIDSIRAFLTTNFMNRPDFQEMQLVLNKCINDCVVIFDQIHILIWQALNEFENDFRRIVSLSNDEITELVRNITSNAWKSLAMADFLDLLADEIYSYPITKDNHVKLSGYADALRVFDSIIIEENNTLLIH